MSDDAKTIRAQLRELRISVRGKTFAQVPEAFKDIEGCKVRLAKLAPPDASGAKAPQVRRHVRGNRK